MWDNAVLLNLNHEQKVMIACAVSMEPPIGVPSLGGKCRIFDSFGKTMIKVADSDI